jgi:hypothetical protein
LYDGTTTAINPALPHRDHPTDHPSHRRPHQVDNAVSFAKGQRKDDLTQQFLAKFTDDEGVLFVGRAQEKAGVWRTQRRYNPVTGGSYAWLVRSSAFINFFYFYCVDADFGPFFIKFSTYFPYTAKLCVNGNEWAKRQATKAGIGFEALDNGFAAVEDLEGLQRICDSLGPEHIEALLRKWLAILPNPFTPEDEDAGSAHTGSSPAFPIPAAIRSPTPGCTTPCCSPMPTTTCCAPD